MLLRQSSAVHQTPLGCAAQTCHQPLRRAPPSKSVLGCCRTLPTAFWHPSNPSHASRRHFWWHRQRTWASQLDPQYQRHIERRYKVLRHKYEQALRRKQLWDREATQPGWQWRLSSSWGGKGSGGRWVDTDRLEEQQRREGEAPSGSSQPESSSSCSAVEADEASSRHAYVDRRIQDMKRRLDEDPFGTLFGRSLDRLDRSSSWTPHGIWKSLGWGFSDLPNAQEDKTPSGNVDGLMVDIRNYQRTLQNKHTDKLSQEPKAAISQMESTTTPEFEIDPITMRKVQKRSNIPTSHQEDILIPVKTFPAREHERSRPKAPASPKTTPKPSIEMSSAHSSVSSSPALQDRSHLRGGPQAISRSLDNAHNSSVPQAKEHDAPDMKGNRNVKQTPTSTWLHEAGFGSTKDRRANDAKSGHQEPQRKLSVPQVVLTLNHESSLTSKSVAVPNKSEEDLLRPVDVRASAGIIKRPEDGAGEKVAEQVVGLEDRSEILNISKQGSPEGNTSSVPAPDRVSESTESKLTYTRFPENKEAELRKQRDKQLVKEIRSVYEEIYGVIDTKHRQTSSVSTQDSPLVEDTAGPFRKYHEGVKQLQASVASTKDTPLIKGGGSSQLGKPVAKVKADSGGSGLPTRAEVDTPEEGAVPKKTFHDVEPITSGLSEYEQKLGPRAYQFRTGLDSLDANVVKPAKSTDFTIKSTESESSGQELATGRKAQERIHEAEANDGIDALQKIKRKLDDLIKEQEAAETKPAESVKSNELPPARLVSPAIYKVLALDPIRQEVISAGTTSSMSTQATNERILSPAEVVPRLHSPARFLPYFSLLQAEGYEIVSGGEDVLVFKKVRESNERPGEKAADIPEGRPPHHAFINPFINPIDGTTTTGNFASPTGFVNYDSILPPQGSEVDVEEPEADGAPNTVSRPPVTNQGEARVTAGGEEKAADASTQQQRRDLTRRGSTGRKVWQVSKGMMLVGVWVAGCSYIVGTLIEGLTG